MDTKTNDDDHRQGKKNSVAQFGNAPSVKKCRYHRVVEKMDVPQHYKHCEEVRKHFPAEMEISFRTRGGSIKRTGLYHLLFQSSHAP